MARKILILTGMSGAGLSSSLKVLEDLGYEVLDNFPVVFIDTLIEETKNDVRPLALGVDTRTRGFSPKKLKNIAEKHDAEIVFLTAEDSALQKRFSETRRRHPLAKDRPITAGIVRERKLLKPIRDAATLVIDTSPMSIHDLRRQLEGRYTVDHTGEMTITLMSFGFRHGVPREADIVMDVRFLKNPNWVPELKEKRGLDKPVGEYIEKDKHFAPFFENFQALIEPLLKAYSHDGKHYLTIAIGCTGGHHRSVYTVEKLAKWLHDKGVSANILHRDITG